MYEAYTGESSDTESSIEEIKTTENDVVIEFGTSSTPEDKPQEPSHEAPKQPEKSTISSIRQSRCHNEKANQIVSCFSEQQANYAM